MHNLFNNGGITIYVYLIRYSILNQKDRKAHIQYIYQCIRSKKSRCVLKLNLIEDFDIQELITWLNKAFQVAFRYIHLSKCLYRKEKSDASFDKLGLQSVTHVVQ